ncbi:beta family protein [Acinetobacter bereziniae]|uniref:beta family protein n=1 Tax=Acinetobacter bereziniae TaxID=106648 RepID=UPI0039089EB6
MEFDFAVHPIPYATYLLNDSFEWFTLREGKGGEYEKFRIIAQKIRDQNGYHGDDFCYATNQIKIIADHSRRKAGNQAFWNKLKINQHISAIIKLNNDGYLGAIGLSHNEEDNDDD